MSKNYKNFINSNPIQTCVYQYNNQWFDSECFVSKRVHVCKQPKSKMTYSSIFNQDVFLLPSKGTTSTTSPQISITTTQSTTNLQPCAAGWIEADNGCYKVENFKILFLTTFLTKK